jgi:hypothetical protein
MTRCWSACDGRHDEEEGTVQEQMTVGAEAPIQSGSRGAAGGSSSPLDDPRALQILSTEHWSLLATRSLSYNETFTRASMFLTFLSATLIVMGFLVGAQGLSTDVLPVVIVLLLADLFVGIATVGRLIDASGEELQSVRGMNRIRHAYREMVPGLEPYFVSGFHDDAHGVLSTYGYANHGGLLANVAHGLTTIIGMIGTIVSLVFAALCGLIATGLGAPLEPTLIVAVVGFGLLFALLAMIGNRFAYRAQERVEARFPTPIDPLD